VLAGSDTTAQHCREHPGRRVRFACERCDAPWCGPCSRRVRTHGFDTTLSPCCREGLDPVAEQLELRPFWSDLPAVLLFALRGGSPLVLAFLWFGGFVPILAWTIPVFAVAYCVHVARRSANDPYTAPNFPEPDDILIGLIYPFLRLLGASLVAWGPWLLYWYYGPEVPNPVVRLAFLVLGLTAYPVIVLSSITHDQLFAALAPSDLLRTIRGMGHDYLALVLALCLFVLAWEATGRIAAVQDVLALFMRFARFYLLVTIFHVLGRSVWQTRDRIDWGI
jgi:hypothetical protein